MSYRICEECRLGGDIVQNDCATCALRNQRDELKEALRDARSQPWLGLATTRQLIEELSARIEVDGKMDYRTFTGETDADPQMKLDMEGGIQG